MMAEFFWSSTQKARKSYRCDWCHNHISPGDEYRREIWKPQKTEVLHVMCYHSEPGCPENFSERELIEVQLDLGTPIKLVMQIKEVVLLQIDGSIIIKSEPEIVFVTDSCEIISEEEDDLPF